MISKCIIFFAVLNVSYTANGIEKDEEVKEVCYEEVGCFPMGKPYYSLPDRPLPAPENPRYLRAFLRLYTRESENEYVDIPLSGMLDLKDALFNGRRNRTVFITGAIGPNAKWPLEMKDALLKKLDANVFYVNTSFAFRGLQTLKAASNARVIGAQLGRFINYLKTNYNLETAEKVWIIGYGLGAHVAGYVGHYVKIARISGLDPMQEFFEGYPPEIRLDKSDAGFVDIIHTDARPMIPDIGLGIMNPAGDVDFYVNGGHGQPGCRVPSPFDFNFFGTELTKTVPILATYLPHVKFFNKNLVFLGELTHVITQFVAVLVSSVYCNHKRAFRIFTEAIESTDCTFWGHKGTMENFLRSISNGGSEGLLLGLSALSSPCNITHCSPMGLDTPTSQVRGVVIVTTTAHSSFCTKNDQMGSNISVLEANWGEYMTHLLGYRDQ